MIKDDTGSATLKTWEKDVGSLKLVESYQVVVRSFKGKTNLSIPPCGASIQPINDLTDVSKTEDSDDHEADDIFIGAKIIGVHQLEYIYICLHYINKM